MEREIDDDDEEIDELVYSLYGITAEECQIIEATQGLVGGLGPSEKGRSPQGLPERTEGAKEAATLFE